MVDGTSLGEPELANLSRLLERAARDPTLLLARACVGDAQQFIARGETTAARRSIQAAQLAIRLSGQASTLGLGPEILPPEIAAAPTASDPPRPPSRPTLD
jgi:hypothetical protein